MNKSTKFRTIGGGAAGTRGVMHGYSDDDENDIWSFRGGTPEESVDTNNIEYEESQSGAIKTVAPLHKSKPLNESVIDNNNGRSLRTPTKTQSTVFNDRSLYKKQKPKLRQLTTTSLRPRFKSVTSSGIENFEERVTQTQASSKRKNSSTVEDPFLDDADGIGTLSQLESSITVEKSPVQIKKTKRRRKLKQVFVVPEPEIITRLPELTEDNYIEVDQSEGLEHLSSQISEIVSTQHSSDDRGQASNSLENYSPSNGKSVLDVLKQTEAQHEFALERFRKDLKKGKCTNTAALEVVIRKVIDRQENDCKVVAYDVKKKEDRWILFRASDKRDIYAGVCLRFHTPWREVEVDGNDVIIGADFYAIIRQKKKELGLDEDKIRDILELPIPKQFRIDLPESFFTDPVPYRVKNNKTVQKELKKSLTHIDVNIVALNVWKYSSSTCVLCLVKDSDEFASFLEVPRRFQDVVTAITSHTYLKLTSVAVQNKTSISDASAPFSILHSFGLSQSFFYSLKWDSKSEWEPDDQIDISMNYAVDNFFSSVEKVGSAPEYQDQRVTLKCKVKDRGNQHVLVRDLVSDQSLQIELVLEHNFDFQTVPFPRNGWKIEIKFLRLIRRKAIWDEYTTYRGLEKEDDVDSDS